VTLVLDGSATLAWCFEDESTSALDALMLRVANDGAIAPALWRIEVANGLQMALRRKRIDEAYRDATLSRLATLDIRIDPDGDMHVWSSAVQLASRYGLTVYDACYLELAQRRRLPLATLDAALARAARQAGVEVTP
jgi:predicted nucleic acid-binding protein